MSYQLFLLGALKVTGWNEICETIIRRERVLVSSYFILCNTQMYLLLSFPLWPFCALCVPLAHFILWGFPQVSRKLQLKIKSLIDNGHFSIQNGSGGFLVLHTNVRRH